MEKAYANFNQTKYYKGFMGKIQVWRKTNNMDNIGIYAIKNLNWDKANKKLIALQEKMNIYEENVYTSTELQFLKDNGVSFEITHGAYSLSSLDFKFNNEMINTKDTTIIDGVEVCKVSYYAKYCGKIASTSKQTSFYLKGNRELLQTITQTDNLQIYSNEIDDEHKICFQKEHLPTKKHITAQILAYQRIQMLEQLLNMDIDKLIRVCVDGIYYEPHDFKLVGVFRPKNEEMTFRNYPATRYISDIIDNGYKPNHNFENLGIERTDYKHELHSGAGGTGKTYYNLIKDRGLIHPIFVALSWKLTTDMAKEYKKKTGKYLAHTVLNQLLEDKGDGLQQKYGTYIIDECSMLTEANKIKLLQTLPKTIFIGDIHCQLTPVIGNDIIKSLLKKHNVKSVSRLPKEELKQMDSSNFDNVINYEKIYRFLPGDKLHDMAKQIRKEIKSPVGKNYLDNLVKKFNIKELFKDEVKYHYNHKEDMIIGASKYQHQYYKEQFKHLEKYKVKTNFTFYKNGEIVYEKIPNVHMELRHCFTVHSVQGLTFEGKLFIDTEMFRDMKMLYTAISRAKSINQIYLVRPAKYVA